MHFKPFVGSSFANVVRIGVYFAALNSRLNNAQQPGKWAQSRHLSNLISYGFRV